MKDLVAFFDSFKEYPLICCICKKKIYEGYYLDPISDEAWSFFIKKFGEPENWAVGECCFGGFCGAEGADTPDDWYKLLKGRCF